MDLVIKTSSAVQILDERRKKSTFFQFSLANQSLLYRYEMKEEIFFKNGSKTACLFPIWSRERKNLPKRSFYMPLLSLYGAKEEKSKKFFCFG